MRLLWLVLGFVGGCSLDAGLEVGASDLSAHADLATVRDAAPRDLVALRDRGVPADLVELPDLVTPRDLATPDLLAPPDLTVIRDLVVVPDLLDPDCFHMTPPAVNFGAVKVGAFGGPISIDIANKCPGPVSISAIVLAGAQANSFVPNPPGTPITLVGGATISMDVSFVPAAKGPSAAEIQITTRQFPLLVVPLAGTGI